MAKAPAPKLRMCQYCGDDISHRPAQARNCSDKCKLLFSEAKRRGEAHKVPAEAKKLVLLRPAGTPPPPELGPDDDDDTILFATRRDLRAAGREKTPLGRTALKLADQLDNPGANTHSAVASLAKQFNEVLAQALANAAPVEDPVELLRRIRDEKKRDAAAAR